jgi:hypothetical protein
MYWKKNDDDDYGGFYPSVPEKADASKFVEITTEEWQALLDGQSQGKEIKDVDGAPTLVERVYTDEELAKTARMERDNRLSAVEWRVTRYNTQVALGITPTEADITPVLEYMQKLRDLPEQEGWPENITWPTVV